MEGASALVAITYGSRKRFVRKREALREPLINGACDTERIGSRVNECVLERIGTANWNEGAFRGPFRDTTPDAGGSNGASDTDSLARRRRVRELRSSRSLDIAPS